MKKILSLIIVLALSLGMLAGCAIGQTDDTAAEATLTDALKTLDTLYKSENGKDTASDFKLVGEITVDKTSFSVVWTTDNESITITKNADGDFVVNLPSENENATIYALIATVTDGDGNSEVYSFTKNLPVLTAGGSNKPKPPQSEDNGNGDNNGNTGDNGNTGNTGSEGTGDNSGNVGGETGGGSTESGKDINGTYTYTFTQKVFSGNETQNLGDVEWTLDGNGGYWGFADRGHQFGSKNNPYESMTLTSESIKGIKEIRIVAQGASGYLGNIFVYVNGVQLDQPNDVDDTSKTFIFDSNTALNGEIEIEFLQSTSKALYIKSITIVCE